MDLTYFTFVAFIACGVLVKSGYSEYYTSIVEMEELVGTEGKIIEMLEDYIKVQESEIKFLRSKAEEIYQEHVEANASLEAYVANPINSYMLTKRLTSDWKQLENLIAHDSGSDLLTKFSSNCDLFKFPSSSDLEGAATALIRLQDLYKLDPYGIANGELNGVQYGKELSASDCFEIGKQMYLKENYHFAILWFEEAWQRFDENSTSEFPKEADILEYWAYSAFKQENHKLALQVARQLYAVDPTHPQAEANLEIYEQRFWFELQQEEEQKVEEESIIEPDDAKNVFETEAQKETTSADDSTDGNNPTPVQEMTKRENYQALCRGDKTRSPSILRPLRCRYSTTSIAFTKIAPFKIEELSLDPSVFLYYDVISDKEIEVVKNLSRSRFLRAGVYNVKEGSIVSTARIGKLAWLRDTEHKYITDITQRTEAISGLSMDTVEDLQVVNYGIAGHYKPHHDFAAKEQDGLFPGLEHLGDRIATVLYYMSDVEQGGATVFPALDITVFPKKGSAIYWINLFKSGVGDYRTVHASCPVLVGSKLICNKWIHSFGQQFRRPCDLEPDHPTDEEVARCKYC